MMTFRRTPRIVRPLFGTLLLCALATGCASKGKPEPVVPAPQLGAAVSQPAPMVETSRGPMLAVDDVLFDFEASSLRREAQPLVAQAARYLQENPDRTAVIEGHTDHIGDAAYNQWLSEARAESVRQALLDRGIAATRLQAQGKGELQPTADNDSPSGRQANRRVEIVFTAAGF